MFHHKTLWSLAYEMACSGEYANVVMIEFELARRGLLAGEQVTSNVLKRELLTRVCHAARRTEVISTGGTKKDVSLASVGGSPELA